MRLKQYINEEYYKRFKGHDGSYEIFKNPSLKELREMPDDIRFMADNDTKDTYIWVWHSVNHHGMVKKFLKKEVKGKEYEDTSLFLGVSDDKGNVISNDTLDWKLYQHYDGDYVDGITSINWSWARPFKIMKYLKGLNIVK
jgi:hypothetical protein